MEDHFKERISAALLGDLLVELAKREKIKKMLGDMDGWAADELIKELLDEFEKLVEERHRLVPPEPPKAPAHEETRTAPSAEPPPSPEPEKEPDLSKHLSFSELFAREWSAPAPVVPDLPSEFPKASDETPAAAEEPFAIPPEPANQSSGGEEKRESAQAAEGAELEKALRTRLRDLDDRESLVGAPEPESSRRAEKTPAAPPSAPKVAHPRVQYDFGEDDQVYIHGVAMIPSDESPSARPFMLEEKGIEDKGFAFALDLRGLRFYLSKIHTRSSNVSKTGILLLNKHESIMMRGRHESILNELRAHGVVLPVEFGTVARGKDELFAKIDAHLADLHLAMEDIAKTEWWDVSVYALDARSIQRASAEAPARPGRERGRSSYASSPSAGKSDIKTLDRLLSKQKKIVEELHEELAAKADRSDTDMMISLGGGTSEDWKLILKASYEVPSSRMASFNRVVTDIQYRHFPFDIMMVVTGEREPFSFQE